MIKGHYKPDLGYIYPEKSDEHMLHVPHLVDTNFDEHHCYYNHKLYYRCLRFIMLIALYLFGFLIVTIRYGLKIEGRKHIKKNKKLFKNGAITTCNHVLMWDYLCVLKAIRPRLPYFLAWPINLEGPNRHMIKLAGGVPIPETRRALVKFNEEVNNILNDKKWLHVFPEGSMWYYYPYIRPLKKGGFVYAVNHNLPVIPMAISYRPAKGLYRFFKGSKPLVTLRIGQPLLVDQTLEKKEAVKKIQEQCYQKMQILAGIDAENFD